MAMTKEQFELLFFAHANPGIDHTALSVYNGPENGRKNRSVIQFLTHKGFLDVERGNLPGMRYCSVTQDGEEALEDYTHQLEVEKRNINAQKWSKAAIIISALSLVVAIIALFLTA